MSGSGGQLERLLLASVNSLRLHYLTQKSLADHLGCDIKVINRIVNSRSAVTAEMAPRLGAAFDTTAERALPKSGKYSGHYGWTFTGQVQKLGEDRVVYAGVVPGVMFNDKGKGFMHKARVDCTIFNDDAHASAAPPRPKRKTCGGAVRFPSEINLGTGTVDASNQRSGVLRHEIEVGYD